MYSRKLTGDEIWNNNSGEPFTLGDIITCVFSTLFAVLFLGFTAPNLKIIQESAINSLDYFIFYKREPKMDSSQSIEKPPRDQIKEKIEFKNVNFYYHSDQVSGGEKQRLVIVRSFLMNPIIFAIR